MSKKDATTCLGCSKKFTGKEFSLQCTVCGLWSHQKCGNVTDELRDLIDLQKKATGITYWACRPCATYAQGMNHRLKEIEEDIREVKKSAATNTVSIQRIEKSVEEIQKKVESNKSVTKEEFESYKWEEKQETKEIKARELNVVIHGIKENPSKEATNLERQEWDARVCGELFLDLKLSLTADSLKFCRRVGERGPNQRPMIVGLFNYRDRATLLAVDTRETELSEVTFGPDLTKKQREEEAEMWKELESKNSQLSGEDKAKNLVGRLAGPKGQRRLIKGVAREQGQGGQLSGPRGAGVRGSGRAGRLRGTAWRGRGMTTGGGGAARGGLLEARGRGSWRWSPVAEAPERRTTIHQSSQIAQEVQEVFVTGGNAQSLTVDTEEVRQRKTSKRKEMEGGDGEEEMEEESLEPPQKH